MIWFLLIVINLDICQNITEKIIEADQQINIIIRCTLGDPYKPYCVFSDEIYECGDRLKIHNKVVKFIAASQLQLFEIYKEIGIETGYEYYPPMTILIYKTESDRIDWVGNIDSENIKKFKQYKYPKKAKVKVPIQRLKKINDIKKSKEKIKPVPNNNNKNIEVELDDGYNVYPPIVGYVFGSKINQISKIMNSIQIAHLETAPGYLAYGDPVSLYDKIAFNFYEDSKCKYTFIINVNHHTLSTDTYKDHEIFNHIFMITYDLLIKYDLLNIWNPDVIRYMRVDLLEGSRKSTRLVTISISNNDVIALYNINNYKLFGPMINN